MSYTGVTFMPLSVSHNFRKSAHVARRLAVAGLVKQVHVVDGASRPGRDRQPPDVALG